MTTQNPVRFIATFAICLMVALIFALDTMAGTFRDDFEDGKHERWAFDHAHGDEKLEIENGALSLQVPNAQKGSTNFVLLQAPNTNAWTDYTITFKAKLVKQFVKDKNAAPHFGIYFRLPPNGTCGSYGFLLDVAQKKVIGRVACNRTTVDEKLPFKISKNTWYEFKLDAQGNRLELSVDDKQIAAFKDGSRASGNVALVLAGVQVYFDDVVIEGPNVTDGGQWDAAKHKLAVDPQNKMAVTWGRIKMAR